MADLGTALKTGGRWALHLALAYVLLCQLTLSGIAVTQHVMAEATGILCEGVSQAGGSAPGDSGRHDALCCELGCAASAGSMLLAPPDGIALDLPTVRALARDVPSDGQAAPSRTLLSFAARGPPARG